MTSVEQKYKFIKPQEAVVLKDWAAGTVDVVETTDFLLTDGKLCVKTFKYPPAWLKAFVDEPVVNAIDHYIRCYAGGHPVSTLRVDFDQTGRITIYNDGPGIEIQYHSVAKMYVPELIYGVLHQGEHAIKAGESITGGTNGIGAKLGNCFSKMFMVETVSGDKIYIQRWRDNMNIVDPPLIKNLNELSSVDKRPHTKLVIMPDYTGLFKYQAFTQEQYELFDQIIATRLLFAAAFASYANRVRGGKQPLRVEYNGRSVSCSGMDDIARRLCPDSTVHTTLAQPTGDVFKHPWEVTAIIDDCLPDKLRLFSNVNGMIVRLGAHFDYMTGELREHIRSQVGKAFKDGNAKLPKQYFKNNVVLLINCHVPNARWKGQAKDILDIPDDTRKQLKYTVDRRFLQQLSDSVKDIIMSSMLQRGPRRTKNEFEEKYKPASMTKRSNWQKHAPRCHLLCAEGDSAEAQIRIGITERLNTDYYGTLIMRGVIINARKESAVITAGGVDYVKKMPKLEKNKFVNALSNIVGLNCKLKYDPASATYRQEMRQLRYHNIVVCVDQDEDGMNILGLFLNMFERFWPKLLAAGFIKWWQTPIVRAYPKRGGTIVKFYNDTDYTNWLQAGDRSGYDIRYYKGLGTHDRAEVLSMCTEFNEHLCELRTTDLTRSRFEVFYGKASVLRKQELSKPFTPMSAEAKHARLTHKRADCDEILNYEVNESQRYNISRKLDNAADGMNLCGRKIFDGSFRAFGSRNKPMKVSQLCGYISADMGYHHGEASLATSITGKAFIGVGGKQLPQLIPLSNFGTRSQGGADAASPRYIMTRFNQRLNNILYPIEDYPNLTFTYTEGARTEPVCYYPIIPTTCTESTHIPAHGWKMKTWARDAFDVIDNVRFMILNEDHSRLLPMRPDTFGWKGRIGYIGGIEASFGTYYYNEHQNMIVITELPLRTWTDPYIEKELIPKLEGSIVYDYDNKSNDVNIRIEITLKPGAYELLENMGTPYCDGIEEYFKLRAKMTRSLNYLGRDKEVLEFKSYDDLVRYWFPLRQDFYNRRIARNLLLMRLDIMKMENKLRYKTEGISLHGKSGQQQNEILSAANYVKFATISVDNVPTDQLTTLMFGPSANYKYLLDITDGGKSTEAIRKLQDKIREARDAMQRYTELAAKGRFPGAQMWLNELDMLEAELRAGRPTRWLYDELSKYNNV